MTKSYKKIFAGPEIDHVMYHVKEEMKKGYIRDVELYRIYDKLLTPSIRSVLPKEEFKDFLGNIDEYRIQCSERMISSREGESKEPRWAWDGRPF